MMFGTVFGWEGFSLFDTHPPIEKRIKRLIKMGAKINSSNQNTRPNKSQQKSQSSTASSNFSNAQNSRSSNSTVNKPSQYQNQTPTWWQNLPDNLKSELEDPESIPTIVFALCLDQKIISQQQQYLQQEDINIDYQQVLKKKISIASLDIKTYIPIVEKTISVLSKMESDQVDRFLSQLQGFTQISIDENPNSTVKSLSIYSVLQQGLKGAKPAQTQDNIVTIWHDSLNLLTILATVGMTDKDKDKNKINMAFNSGAFLLPNDGLKIPSEALALDLDSFSDSLENINNGTQKLKDKIFHACIETVISKGQIKDMEILLLGSIAFCLNCSYPSIIKAE